MPGKGPRLWLRPARFDAGGCLTHAAVWTIIDGSYQRSTRCGADDGGRAERALAAYIAEKHVSASTQGDRHPAAIPVADVIALYAADVAPLHARPKETRGRLRRLLAHFGDKRLSDINGKSCRQYVAARSSAMSARRELEELRAAINYHRKEGGCSHIVAVALPERHAARERWLTRTEAAQLLWTAWRARERQGAVPTKRRPWQHVARFILVALYTGSRSTAIVTASFEPRAGVGWIDVGNGVFHRRPPVRANSKKRQPPIPLPGRLLAHLERWERKGLAGPVEWNRAPVERVGRAFRKVAKAAGLAGVTPHTLRHTATTWLMQAGVDPWAVGGYLGMSIETVSRVYAHHHPDHLKAAIEGFEKHRSRQWSRQKNAGAKRERKEKIA